MTQAERSGRGGYSRLEFGKLTSPGLLGSVLFWEASGKCQSQLPGKAGVGASGTRVLFGPSPSARGTA